MKSIDVSARTIEEAVSDGLDKLGCSISDCKVEILQEGAKGLFGFFGSKPATVRLTLISDDDEDEIDLQSSLTQKPAPEKPARAKPERKPAPEKKTAEKKPEPKKPAPEKNRMRIASNPQVVDKPKTNDVLERFKSAPLPGDKEKPEKAEKAEKPAKAPRAPKPPREPRQPRAERSEPREDAIPAEERVAIPAPEHIEVHGADTLEGRAQQFLLDVTHRMGVDVQVDVHRGEDGHLFVTMYGDTLGILIGRRGETLDALQYLTSLQVNRGQEEYTRVTLDTENYRAKREEALVRLANRMASRAIKTGRKVSLEPMNPYERRILHSSLQGNPDVTTHSEGDEPYRHVVVVPVK